MNTRMPEAVSAETQLGHLREKLLGNKSFRACRGKLNRSVADIINEFIDQVDNPTQFCKTWDEMNAAMRVMGNLLAQYKRDGYDVAYNELLLALKSTHIITGETIPFDETLPVTIVMFDPVRTSLMIRWIIDEHWQELNGYLNWVDSNGKDCQPSKLTEELFQNFPTLEAHCRERRRCGDYEGWDLSKAYHESVLSKFLVPKGWTPLKIGFGQWNDHIEIADQTFAFVVIGKDQAEVLSLFSREEQKSIATWHVNAPSDVMKTNSERARYYCVGFHEGTEHWHQSQKHPALTSKGVQAGWGVRILTHCPNHPFETNNPQGYKVPHQGNRPEDGGFRIFMITN